MPVKKKPTTSKAVRGDSFANAISNIGTSTDPSSATLYYADYALPPQTLSAMYAGDWLTRKVVEEFPTQALRGGFTLDRGDDEESTELQARFDALDKDETNPRGHFFRALVLGRLYGGAAVILGVRGSGSNARAPLKEGAELLWLDSCTRWQLQILETEKDANSPRFGKPTIYKIVGNHPRRDLEIHASRLILCEGLEPPNRDDLLGYDLQGLWWLSVIQAINAALARFGISWASVSSLINGASVAKFKMAGLYDAIASGDEAVIRNRMLLTAQGISVTKAVFLDAEANEDFSRDTVNFTGLPDLMTQIALTVGGATQIPVAILFGQAPAGLNATGESDMRQFYDRITAYRKTSIEPKLKKIFAILAGEEVALEFAPLWEMSDLEKAQLRLANFQADALVYNLGLDGAEILLSRANDNSLGLTVDIAELEKRLEQERESHDNPPQIPPQLAPGQNPQGAPGTPEGPRDPDDIGLPAGGEDGEPADPTIVDALDRPVPRATR